MKKWYHVVRDARLIYLHRDDFAYLYGSNGERPKNRAEAEKLVNGLWSAYPEHFETWVIGQGYTKEDLIRHVTGRICFDCSAFVCAVTQSEGSIYDLTVKNDMSSYGLHNVATNKTTVADGLWGNLLWKQGHVAIDVGNGLAIDFGAEFADCREYRLIDPGSTKFTDSGRLPWVDYKNGINY